MRGCVWDREKGLQDNKQPIEGNPSSLLADMLCEGATPVRDI